MSAPRDAATGGAGQTLPPYSCSVIGSRLATRSACKRRRRSSVKPMRVPRRPPAASQGSDCDRGSGTPLPDVWAEPACTSAQPKNDPRCAQGTTAPSTSQDETVPLLPELAPVLAGASMRPSSPRDSHRHRASAPSASPADGPGANPTEPARPALTSKDHGAAPSLDAGVAGAG